MANFFAHKLFMQQRLRRRHRLLLAISLIFSITWLPLNVLNLTHDLFNPFTLPRDREMMNIIYATCHLFGMSSACANPFLYGWFNENFRRGNSPYRRLLCCPAELLTAMKCYVIVIIRLLTIRRRCCSNRSDR